MCCSILELFLLCHDVSVQTLALLKLRSTPWLLRCPTGPLNLPQHEMGKIHILVVRKECDISVGHLYKWALRVVER